MKKLDAYVWGFQIVLWLYEWNQTQHKILHYSIPCDQKGALNLPQHVKIKYLQVDWFVRGQ